MPPANTRSRYVAAGMCSNCGRHPPREGLKTCAICRESMKRWRNANPEESVGKSKLRPIDYHHCEHCSLRGHTQQECDLRRTT
jgi:hypothetical protein